MAQLQDFAVTSLEDAEKALSELKQARKEMEEYAPLLQKNISVLKDLENTTGLAEQCLLVWEPQVQQVQQVVEGMDAVIALVQKLVQYFQTIDEMNKKNALAGAFGE